MDPEFSYLFEFAWNHLEAGRDHRKHPFHTFALATQSEEGPEVRTAVLRRVSRTARTVGFQADRRSPKVKEMIENPRVALCFYSFPDRLQVRIKALASVYHLDEIAEEAWSRVALLSRRSYLIEPGPSAESARPSSGIPDHLVGREPDEEESIPGFQNFAFITCHISELDVLALEYTGNKRARYCFESGAYDRSELSENGPNFDPNVNATWVIP